MKKVYVQKQVIGWEEYEYEVPDDFKDYKSLEYNDNWTNYQYLEDSSENTGLVEMFDEDYNTIKL